MGKKVCAKHLFYLILFFVEISIAQKETNTWYFGKNAGLDFSSGMPQPLNNGKLNTIEGCSTVSDSLGNLLFYTDGISVWNKNHIQMPNGSGLFGNYSSTQSALIVRKPGSASIYYIFTTDANDGAKGLSLNEVDMMLQGGLGDITKKNILLNPFSTEKLAGIRHCNGREVWVVTHDCGSKAFRNYLVTSTGVSPSPVVSYAGLNVSCGYGSSIGQLKASPDGSKLASANQTPGCFELFDFNNATGEVSNEIIFPKLSATCYGVEFSPDGTKMYGSTSVPSKIYQFDLSTGLPDSIVQSGKIIGTAASNVIFGSLQIGPDKKIYVAKGGYTSLGIIKDPNIKGTGCNYISDGIGLGKESMYGLPNMVNSFDKAVYLPFTFTINCLEVFFTCPKSIGDNSITSVSWNFGDPVSKDNSTPIVNPKHLFAHAGTYEVTLSLNYKCGVEILKQKVIIDPPKAWPTNISGIKEFCIDKNEVLSVSISGTYLWSSGENTQSITAEPVTKNYSVTVTTSAGCTYTGAKAITVHPLPVVTAKAYTLGELTSQLVATGGVFYNWSPAEGLNCNYCKSPVAVYPGTTSYCVKATDDKGCTGNACVDIFVSSVFIPNAFTPNEDDLNEFFTPVVNEVHNYNFLVYDRWGKKLFEASQSGKGWDGFYKGEMCEQNVYVYKLTFIDNVKNEPHEYAGKVVLIR